MKHLKIIFALILIFMFACKSRYHIDFAKITLEKVELKKNQSFDSLQLNFTLKIPPKSVGKKGLVVILPMIINESDTLKFKTMTLAGEGVDDDCGSIPYKFPTTRKYESKESISRLDVKNAFLKIQLSFIKNDKNVRADLYQKELLNILK
jgi:hypothetical protein